jgi:hypothetical protein
MKPQSCSKKFPVKAPAERVVKDIRRATRRHLSAKDKIRIVLEGLCGGYGDRRQRTVTKLSYGTLDVIRRPRRRPISG